MPATRKMNSQALHISLTRNGIATRALFLLSRKNLAEDAPSTRRGRASVVS